MVIGIKMRRKFGTQIYSDKSNNIVVYQSSIGQLAPLIQRWYQNRPEDINRVNEMTTSMRESSDNLIDGVIYCWNHDKKLHCYDGWTRYCAGYNLLVNDKRDMQVILHVNSSGSENAIVEHFVRLNKAVPVPSLYTTNTSPVRRLFIETIVSEIQKQYPMFVSTSRNPRKPNYNRDQMIEVFDTALPDPLGTLKMESIMRYIKEINQTLLRDLPSSALPQKAVKHEFALFCVSVDVLAQRIRDRTLAGVDLGEDLVDLMTF